MLIKFSEPFVFLKGREFQITTNVYYLEIWMIFFFMHVNPYMFVTLKNKAMSAVGK